jgi:hypothetical protein
MITEENESSSGFAPIKKGDPRHATLCTHAEVDWQADGQVEVEICLH